MDPKLLAELRGVFDEEVAVQRTLLARLLITLERDTSSPEDLDAATTEAFRIAHALKGAARAVGAEEIIGLAHRVEERLLGVRRGQRVPREDAIAATSELLDGLPDGRSDAPAPDAVHPPAADVSIQISSEALLRMRDEARELRAHLLVAGPGGEADIEQTIARERAVAGAAALSEGLQRLCAQPVDAFVDRLERNALEVARGGGKRVRFVVEGGALRVDRGLLRRVFEALQHLVSNAVDHGLESPDERTALGKPAYGTITLRVRPHGMFTTFSIRDDGRGIDLQALRLQAPEAAEPAFEPGVSTSSSESNVSGRGMGMAFVRQSAAELGGTAEVKTELGAGTTVELRVPMNEGGVSAVLVGLENTTYAIPLESVERIVRLNASSFGTESGASYCVVDERRYPVVRLHRLLCGERAGGRLDPRSVGVMLRARQPLVVLVPRVLELAEIVARPLRGHLEGLPLVTATFRRPTGSVGLVLDMAAVGRRIRDGHVDEAKLDFGQPARRVLVVDDSVTTRLLVRVVLEGQGYTVDTASGGAVAWQRLIGHDYALVVSDLEMPHMDGFELLSRCRAEPRLANIPFIVLTGRQDTQTRDRCLGLGATAFVEKGTFETDELVEVVAASLGASR